jgi:hypothetical protein
MQIGANSSNVMSPTWLCGTVGTNKQLWENIAMVLDKVAPSGEKHVQHKQRKKGRR